MREYATEITITSRPRCQKCGSPVCERMAICKWPRRVDAARYAYLCYECAADWDDWLDGQTGLCDLLIKASARAERQNLCPAIDLSEYEETERLWSDLASKVRAAFKRWLREPSGGGDNANQD